MDRPLRAPWRMEYLVGPKDDGPCAFCGVREASSEDLRERLVVCRTQRAFVMLNRYPYTAGHLLAVPYQHVSSIEELDDATNDALFRLLRDSLPRLRSAVRCQGINVGLNLGQCAGSSIREHVHVQIVPRWEGDHNFMPVTSGTRVIPQALTDTMEMLRPAFADLDIG